MFDYMYVSSKLNYSKQIKCFIDNENSLFAEFKKLYDIYTENSSTRDDVLFAQRLGVTAKTFQNYYKYPCSKKQMNRILSLILDELNV